MPLPARPWFWVQTTVNIGTISFGGRAPNVVPDFAKAELAIRTVERRALSSIKLCARRYGARAGEVKQILSFPAMFFAALPMALQHRWYRFRRIFRCCRRHGENLSCLVQAAFRWRTPWTKKYSKRELLARRRDVREHDAHAPRQSGSGQAPLGARESKHMSKNLAIVGYGKMGRLIEQACSGRRF